MTNSVASPDAQSGSWHIQLGAVVRLEAAHALLDSAVAQHEPLRDSRPHVERFERHGQGLYRARYLGFGSREAASKVCATLTAASVSCLVIGS